MNRINTSTIRRVGVLLLSMTIGGCFALLAASVAEAAFKSPGAPAGTVNDYAGILSAEQRAALGENLDSFYNETRVPVIVAIIPSLNGESTIEDYANSLYREWGIGASKNTDGSTGSAGTGDLKDKGALMLVSIGDRKMWIEIGYGLEPIVQDSVASRIIQDRILPEFRNEKYYEGISAGVMSLEDVIRKDVVVSGADYGDSNDSGNSSEKDIGFWVYLVIFAFFWLASVLGRSSSWWMGGIVGGVAGVIMGFVFGFVFVGILSIIGFALIGLAFDFIVSRAYSKSAGMGKHAPWWIGGGGFGGGFGSGRSGGGSSFGGFGGGSSGGGGAGGSW